MLDISLRRNRSGGLFSIWRRTGFFGTVTLMPLPMEPINATVERPVVMVIEDQLLKLPWSVAANWRMNTAEFRRQYRWMSGFRLELEPDPSYARYSLHSDSLGPKAVKTGN